MLNIYFVRTISDELRVLLVNKKGVLCLLKNKSFQHFKIKF